MSPKSRFGNRCPNCIRSGVKLAKVTKLAAGAPARRAVRVRQAHLIRTRVDGPLFLPRLTFDFDRSPTTSLLHSAPRCCNGIPGMVATFCRAHQAVLPVNVLPSDQHSLQHRKNTRIPKSRPADRTGSSPTASSKLYCMGRYIASSEVVVFLLRYE